MEPHSNSHMSPRPHQARRRETYSASFDPRTRSDDSWVEVSSQPSSSSLSSVGDEVVTTGLRVDTEPRRQRRRSRMQSAPSGVFVSSRLSHGAAGTGSRVEFEESDSESDQVMTSSNEAVQQRAATSFGQSPKGATSRSKSSDDGGPRTSSDEDENRTTINYPIRDAQYFTPQPNAFSHPPASHQMRQVGASAGGSDFPSQARNTRPSMNARHSLPNYSELRPCSVPRNTVSPTHNAAAQHDEALRTSLSTLLSCAAAARALPKTSETKQPTTVIAPPPRTNKMNPTSFRLVPQSALPETRGTPTFEEPTFQPTLRRESSTSTTSSADYQTQLHITRDSIRRHQPKRKSLPGTRTSSRERRSAKKVRRTTPSSTDIDDIASVSPTLLTWVLGAGVLAVLSALSFSAGYSMGREAGRLEAAAGGMPATTRALANGSGDEMLRTCAREAGRQSLGLKRSLARSTVQV